MVSKKIINFFENNKSLQKKGTTVSGINEKVKKSIDISIDPKNLNNPEFDDIKRLNRYITPIEILNQRKKFRTTVLVRNIYSEVLNILQAVVMNKASNKKLKTDDRKYLNDAMITSIAGISAAMKNTG